MFRNSHNLRGLSSFTRNQTPRWRTIFIALVLALAIGSLGQPPLAQAAPAGKTDLRFWMYALKKGAVSTQVCVGERVTIQVLVYRMKIIDGVSQAPDAVTGVDVIGLVDSPNIGQISPDKSTTLLASSVYPGAADFVFHAKSPGEATITFTGTVGVGWFGTSWGGSRGVTADVSVRVVHCKFKVEVTSHWNNNVRGIYLATMDETEITADADGHYTGSAGVNWLGTFIMDACPKEYTIAPGQASLEGELDDNGQLIGTLTQQPVAVTFNGACGNLSGTDNFQVSQAPLRFSLPASGGVSTIAQVLTGSSDIGSFDGSVVIVVTPLEDQAAAFIPGTHQRAGMTFQLYSAR